MPCLHLNAYMNNNFLCCIDCNRKLNGVLKQTKSNYKPSIPTQVNFVKCGCNCHINGHAFCVDCRNKHGLGEDKMNIHSQLIKAQTVLKGFSRDNFPVQQKGVYKKLAKKIEEARRSRDLKK